VAALIATQAAAQMREETFMPKHDEGRRAFLLGTAVAGAAATTALVPDALAQTNNQDMPMQGDVMAPAMDGGHGAFFNDEDGRTIAAFAERLMPGAPGKPGATDADVRNYIDLALAGAYTDEQEFYRHGLAALDDHCHATYGKAFRTLSAAQQDETIAALEHGKTKSFSWPTAQAFFNTLHKHTMEGMFSDPVYGGNKNFAGWILVGFPGAQMQFTEQDMQSKEAFTREPVVGMQAMLKSKRG
jgi:gluconate 2-dehydrogenase gamma chain